MSTTLVYSDPPQHLATCSAKCGGKCISVEIHAPASLQVVAPGGTAHCLACMLRFKGAHITGLDVVVDAGSLTGLDPRERELVNTWLPKKALLAAIDVLCGRCEAGETGLVRIIPDSLRAFDEDPQKADMAAFRRRCRYDILRVIGDRLESQDGQLSVSVNELSRSHLLTRLYSDQDLVESAAYWHQKGFLNHRASGLIGVIDVNLDEQIFAELADYDSEEAPAPPPPRAQAREYDVFICHASEDKDEFVRPLAQALRQHGSKVWYDEFSLKLGDRLRRSIDAGLLKSRHGIVVLSRAFFEKDWPQYELDGLTQLESDGRKVILPIWHGIDRSHVLNFSPPLADRVAARSNEGLEVVVQKIVDAIPD